MDKEKELEIMRHSLSHVMAAAVRQLWPKVKFAIGPAIENGFYYDFDFGQEKVSEEDLAKIEKKMEEIIKKDLKFERSEMKIDEAIAKEKKSGQIYKQELVKDFKSEGEKKVSYYKLEDFIDLCRGPHLVSSGKLKNSGFKLTKLAGAYWRGDEKRPMLTRIYAAAFASKKELEDYLKMMAEAEKRDHRKIGKELDLFSMHEEAPGMPFWHDKGNIIFNTLAERWRKIQRNHGYAELKLPHILDVGLWKQSGHYEHYKDSMFFTSNEGRKMALRPMDCPGAILVYKEDLRSYRDFPLRWSELGIVYRNEKSGELHGLLRVQHITQDDAHIFISEDMIEDEVTEVLKIMQEIYEPFGLKTEVFLSTRPDDAMGDPKIWAKAEKALANALKKNKIGYGLKEKDGAFYGPKIDIHVKDSLGRTWQTGTIQLDFFMPKKFSLKYIDKEGKEKQPVIVHRALMGSLERFIGILIEHYAGAFPVWLAPVQVKIISVGEGHIEFCQKLAGDFRKEDVRVEVDKSNETVGNKIRKAVGEKTPYVLVVGDKEMGSANLAVRDRGEQKTREVDKEKFIAEVKEKIKSRK
ncbi:MAG: threonine--tRNA ligase [Patescibacteria group bacterium]|nr:threonine--tRNA ligase [Patescibacteria group bacterium]